MKKRTANSEQPTANSQQRTANSQQQIAVMLELLRSAVLDRDPVLDPAVNVDWDDLMDRASKQGILAWVYDGICKLPKEQQPPRQQRINWALSALEIWDRYRKQKEVLVDMVKVCDDNGLRMLLLKGIGLSELYPKPESRPSGDIDVYFGEHYEKANLLFGNDNVHKNRKHSEFVYRGVTVENHFLFLFAYNNVRKKIEEYLEQKSCYSERNETGYYTLTPDCNLLYLLMHAVRHMNYPSGIGYRTFVDFYFLIIKNQDILTPQKCREITENFGVSHCFDLMIYIVERILAVDLKQYRLGIVPECDQEQANQQYVRLLHQPIIPDDESVFRYIILRYHQKKASRWKKHYGCSYWWEEFVNDIKMPLIRIVKRCIS